MKKLLISFALVFAVSAFSINLTAQEVDSLFVAQDSILADEPLFEVDQSGIGHFPANTWQAADGDGVSVCANLARLNKHGKYYLVELYLYNDSNVAKGFDFKGMRLVTPHHSRSFLPLEKYLKSQKSKGFWKSVMASVGIWIAATILDEALNGDDSSVGSAVSSILITEAAFIGTDLVTEHYRERFANIVSESLGYLRDIVIEPGHAVDGFALIPRKKTNGPLTVEVPYAGNVFRFTWEKSTLETLQ